MTLAPFTFFVLVIHATLLDITLLYLFVFVLVQALLIILGCIESFNNRLSLFSCSVIRYNCLFIQLL